jgi:hypothetical protein
MISLDFQTKPVCDAYNNRIFEALVIRNLTNERPVSKYLEPSNEDAVEGPGSALASVNDIPANRDKRLVSWAWAGGNEGVQSSERNALTDLDPPFASPLGSSVITSGASLTTSDCWNWYYYGYVIASTLCSKCF